MFNCKHDVLLFCAVLGNILIWLVEQWLDLEFEFLSVSYILSGLLLLFIYGMLQDYGVALGDAVCLFNEAKEDEGIDIEKLITIYPELADLTAREIEVLKLLLEDKLKRKEMADELSVTEHTIKKHTAHIFTKMKVSTRKELREKLRIRD